MRTALLATLELLGDHDTGAAELEDRELHLLVVDDSAFSRRHVTRVLGSPGITHIDHAENGVEALELLRARRYDFVVTDHNMPQMDGGELVDRIHQDTAQSSLPILMFTSEADQNRLAAVQQSGVSAIFDMPFEPAMVRNLVRNMVAD